MQGAVAHGRNKRNSETDFDVIVLGTFYHIVIAGRPKKYTKKKQPPPLPTNVSIISYFRPLALTLILFDRLWATPFGKYTLDWECTAAGVLDSRSCGLWTVDAIKGEIQTIYNHHK